MAVSINFLGMQQSVTKIDSMDIPITEEMRVSDALEHVRKLYPDLHLGEGVIIITVNQELAQPDQLLNPRDSIAFLPHIGGG